jgi:hypothetical protein
LDHHAKENAESVVFFAIYTEEENLKGPVNVDVHEGVDLHDDDDNVERIQQPQV